MMKTQSVFAFLAGAALGAAVALLVAPDSGKNTRHKIADKVREGKERALELAEEGKEKARELVGKGQQKAKEMVEKNAKTAKA